MSKRKVAIIFGYALIALFAVSPLLPMLTVDTIDGLVGSSESIFGDHINGACWILHHFYLITVPIASVILTIAAGTHLQHRLAVRKANRLGGK